MTKRFVIFITALSIATATAFQVVAADLFSDHNVSLGVKGGMSLSKVNFQSSIPQKLIRGLVFGASIRYIEEKHFGIIAELNFH